MFDTGDTHLYRLWFLTIVILMAGNLVLLSFHLSGINAISTDTAASTPDIAGRFKAFADQMSTSTQQFGHRLDLTGRAVKSGAQNVAIGLIQSTALVGHVAQDSTVIAGRFLINSTLSMVHVTDHGIKLAANVADLSSLVTPADKADVPVITPAITLPPAPANQPAQSIPAAQWPIRGSITLPFGVSDWPFERVHTGIDISDGKAPGTTPIRPFKPGMVAQVIRSSAGLGNHVVVDNGGGITSVYGHMSSISVQPGQQVNENTVLGYEGSTGASTGTHVHFEIRVNGQPVNPRGFINGLP